MRSYMNIVEQSLIEIDQGGSRDEFLIDYARHFRNSIVVDNFREADLRIIEDTDMLRLGFFDESNSLFAYLCIIKDHTNELPVIGLSAVDLDFRNRGWMRYILDWYLQNKGPLLSDVSQTLEAQQMWQAILARPGKMKISKYTISSNSKEQIRPNNSPWDGSDDTCLMIEAKSNLSESLGRVKNYYGLGRVIFNP